MSGLKTRYKIVGIVALGGIAVVGAKTAMDHGWIPAPAGMIARVPDKIDIKTLASVQLAPAQNYEIAAAPSTSAPKRTLLTIPWQAAGSLILANGGGGDASGTLMQKYAGSNLHIERQDDYGKMQEQMLKFATGLKNGEVNPGGAAYSLIMGDGYPAFVAALQPQMKKLGQSVEVIGITGFSYGEDKCMGPDTGGDANKLKGLLIAAVPRDGDWNICVKLASDSGIPINTDNSVFDPGAMNFVDTDSFVIADEKFIAGACEDRDEALKGVKTGKKVHVCVNGVATWTPGDVTVMEKKGGVVALASTREYNQQMAATIIGIKSEVDKNRPFVVGMLRAVDRASFQIRTTPDGVHKMAEAEALVFGTAGGDEAKASYWARYFVGFDSPDGKVKLGGSRVSTLAEVRDYLGLSTGMYNVYKGVYDTFGAINTAFYPKIVPSVPDYDSVVDTSFTTDALKGTTMTAPKTTEFAKPATITQTVSQRAVRVEFATGTATISPASRAKLVDIANQSGMTNLLIRIEGHTDNTGNSDLNVNLSRKRAQAVADALTAMAPSTFPANRLEVRGYGDTKPVADNATDAGRQSNRRVEIILGK